MQYRRIGRTNVHLSTVGMGTAQLRLVPEAQAIDTLLRGFARGVNWAHVAPDYGGAEELVAAAIRRSGRKDLIMASVCYQTRAVCERLFEHTCRLLGTDHLPLYGLACIDDREFCGENVWQPGGQIEFLRELKQQGRVGAIYCTTHAPPDRVAALVECGVFDAIMLAYNPLGSHVLSYHARAEGRQAYEDLLENRRRIFPLAAERQVSLLVMKPFAGGLLCDGKAFPTRHHFTPAAQKPKPRDLLREILALPGVTSVCPGTASVDEAEDNAAAGEPAVVATAAPLAPVIDAMRAQVCTRCGECEPTCSKQLPVSWLVREAYLWSHPGDSFETIDRHHFLVRHPSTALACDTCSDRTCRCPIDLDVPTLLATAHRQVLRYRADGRMHNTPAERQQRTFAGHLPGAVVLADVPRVLPPATAANAQIWLENRSHRRWSPDARDASTERVHLRVHADGFGSLDVPLRHLVEPGERAAFVFAIPPVPQRATFAWTASLVSPAAVDQPERATPVAAGHLSVEDRSARVPSLGDEHRTLASYGARYLDWSVPLRAAPGARVPLRFVVENTGTMTWRAAAPLGNRVSAGLFLDGGLVATLELSAATVRPGEAAVFRHDLELPEAPGEHVLRLQLVEQQLTVFTDRGVPPLDVPLRIDASLPDENGRLQRLAERVFPWHYRPTTHTTQALDGTPLPMFARSAEGYHITDVAGRRYIDFTMGWATTVLGYAHPHVREVMSRALATAPLLAYAQPILYDLAARLVDRFPGSEMALFGKNGSDVCTLAARIARVATGRRTILFSGYHGWGDFWVEQHPFASTGVPPHEPQLIHRFRFNDRESFLALFERHRDDLAAIMLEPSGPWGGNEIGHEPDVDPGFLALLRQKADDAGALLVFDEIVTGFRYPRGSVQVAHGVRPDLTCLGKALASGLPLSALLGPRSLIREFYPRTHFGPTFREETLSMHAAMATLDVCDGADVPGHINQFGDRLRAGIDERVAAAGLRGWCKGPPFRMSLYFDEPDRTRWLQIRTLFHQEMLRHGISMFSNGVLVPCFVHDEPALTATLAATAHAAGMVRRALDVGDFTRFLEIPPLPDM